MGNVILILAGFHQIMSININKVSCCVIYIVYLLKWESKKKFSVGMSQDIE